MAGIGFELSRAFKGKGILALVNGYMASGMIFAGPMFLGGLMVVSIREISVVAGLSRPQMLFLQGLVTYIMVVSIMIVNSSSLVSIRYAADLIYEEKYERVMPSFWGSTSLYLVAGSLLCLPRLFFMELSGELIFLCFVLFGEMVMVWNEMNYLTAIKDFLGVVASFFVAVSLGVVSAYVTIIYLGFHTVTALMFSFCITYGVLSVWFAYLLDNYFPRARGSGMYFLKYFDRYRDLWFYGICMQFAIYGHIAVMWFSPIGRMVWKGIYHAPLYDEGTMFGVASAVIATIDMSRSMETRFSKIFGRFLRFLNGGAPISYIEDETLLSQQIMYNELFFILIKQFIITLCFLVFGSVLIPEMNLGLTHDMLGTYRVLCVGYAFFAIGNSFCLVLLYFMDYSHAFVSALLFAIGSIFGTWVTIHIGPSLYGAGFMVGAACYAFFSFFSIVIYQNNLLVNICRISIVEHEHRGLMTLLCNVLTRYDPYAEDPGKAPDGTQGKASNKASYKASGKASDKAGIKSGAPKKDLDKANTAVGDRQTGEA